MIKDENGNNINSELDNKVIQDPGYCPYCDANDLFVIEPTTMFMIDIIDSYSVEVKVKCNECNLSWIIEVGVSGANVPEPEDVMEILL